MKYALNLTCGNFVEAPTVRELKSKIGAKRLHRDHRSDVWKLFPDWEAMSNFGFRNVIARTTPVAVGQLVYVAQVNKLESHLGGYERTQEVFGVYTDQYEAIVRLSRHIREALDAFDGYNPLIRQHNLEDGNVEISASDSKNGVAIEFLGYILTKHLQ